jgi:polar amino acid transport system ATP-binding protein
MIILKNVTKKFNGKTVLDTISTIIEQGSIVGLAGSSGSGKSTLLRSIQKFTPIDSGSITYNQRTGFIFQDFQLFEHMTVLENILYAPTITLQNKNFLNEINPILTKLKLNDQKNMLPHKLSGGQKQRTALARTIIMNPEILLCDEPTSGLDVATIDDIIDLLKSIKTKDMTIIIASHDLDFLTRISNRILVLKQGSIQLDIQPNQTKKPIELIKKYY